MRLSGVFLTLLLLLVVSLPYFLAAQAGAGEFVFGGFLLNPIDGNSYLAKMYAGWRGDLRFRLPFTAEPGEGAFLFLFYLFLGKVAGWTGLPNLLVFHLARLVGAVALAFSLQRLLSQALPASGWKGYTLALAMFGSGLGWLAVPFGELTSDLWVAEAFPFLSSYANPHFPLSLAVLSYVFTLPAAAVSPDTTSPLWSWRGLWRWAIPAGLAGLALAVLLPFGAVLALGGLAGLAAWQAVERWQSGGGSSQPGDRGWRLLEPDLAWRLAGLAAGSLPYLLYTLWVVRHDPQLAAWNAQNLTPTPPWWDLLLAFAPAWLLALPGAWGVAQRGQRTARLLLVWALLAGVLLVAPLGLQRRFMLGLDIPLALLAAWGLDQLSQRLDRRVNLLATLALLLALPTNLLIMLAAGHAIQTHDRAIFLTRGESQALTWLAQNTPESSLTLAAPETGLLIPAWTGRRVLYGHPFETVAADSERQAVQDFFKSCMELACDWEFLQQRGVDYIFYGPREQELASSPGLTPTGVLELETVFTAADVTVYQVRLP